MLRFIQSGSRLFTAFRDKCITQRHLPHVNSSYLPTAHNRKLTKLLQSWRQRLPSVPFNRVALGVITTGIFTTGFLWSKQETLLAEAESEMETGARAVPVLRHEGIRVLPVVCE